MQVLLQRVLMGRMVSLTLQCRWSIIRLDTEDSVVPPLCEMDTINDQPCGGSNL